MPYQQNIYIKLSEMYEKLGENEKAKEVLESLNQLNRKQNQNLAEPRSRPPPRTIGKQKKLKERPFLSDDEEEEEEEGVEEEEEEEESPHSQVKAVKPQAQSSGQKRKRAKKQSDEDYEAKEEIVKYAKVEKKNQAAPE